MKNVFFATLWLTIAIVCYVFGQPLITLAIGICAATEIYAQCRLRQPKGQHPGASMVARSLAAEGGHPSRRHHWMALL